MKGFLSLLSRFNKRVRECFLLLFPTFASLVSAATYEQYVDGLYYIFDSSTGKAAVTYTTNFDKIYYDDYNNIDHNKINYDDSYIEIPETVFAYNYETGSFMDFEVTAIGDSAFARSYNLEEIYLPSSIKTIGKSAFEGCVNLPRIELPEDVTLIDEAAFRYCKNLTDIDLPASLDSLGNYAFEFSGLKSIVIPECVKYLDRQISDCPNLEYVSIPKSVIYVWVWAFQRDAKLKRIDVSYYNTNYQSIGGILYDKSGTELVAYPADLEQHVNVPSFVKKIKTFAFEENKKMLSVVIPESVEIIEFRAFMQCGNLEKVTFSDGLKEIGGEAFAECFSLKEMTLPNSVERIAVGAFGACAISEVVLPNNLTEISSRFTEKESSWGAGRHPGSFSGCSELKNVVLPESLSNIGLGAFYMCKNLETINIPASVTSIDKNALKGCNNAVVTLCSDKFSATDEVFKDVKEVVLCDELKENPVDKELNQNDLTPDFVIEGWFNVDEKTSRLVPLDACGAVYHVYINPQGDNAMFAIKYSNAKGGIKEVNSSIDQKLLKVENNHDGEGLCQFTLPGSSTLRDFYMDISKDPVAVSETVPENYEMIMISTDSKLKSVNIGSKIKFTTNLCISDANADPTYSWQISKDGETWIEPSSNTGKDFEYTALSDIKYIKCEGLYVDASDETHTVKSNVITLSLNDPTFNVEIVGNGVRNVNTTEKEVPALSNVIIKMVDLPSSNVSNPKISYKPLGGTSSYKTLDDAVLNEDDLSWSVYADKSGRMKIEVDVEVPTFYDTPKTVTLKKEFIFRLVYSPDKEDAVLELFFDDFGYFKGNEYHYVKYEDGTVIDSNAVETVDASLPSSVKWMDDQNGFIKEHKFALTDSKNDFSSILEDGKVNIDKCWTMGENVRPYRCWCENGYRVEDGYYAFVPNPAMADGGPKSDGSSNDYWNGSDHTGSADGSSLGAMLMVNCADVNDKVIYERDFEINGDHSDVKVFFSAFVSNAQALSDAGAPVNIRMDIYEKGGTEVITSIESGDVISRNYGANSWSNLTASFPLSKGKFTLKISNSAASGSGNDILLDDISLKISSPVQTQPGIVPAITTAKLCEANVTSLLVTGADALSTANVGREKDYVYKVNGSDVTLQVSGVFGPAVDVVWEKCETKPNDLASFVWTPVATQKSNIPLVVSVTSDVIYRATFNKGMPGHSGKQDQRALFVTSGLISDISKACPNEAVQLDVIGGKFSSRTEWLLGYGSDAVKRVKEYTDGTMTFTLNASDSPLKGYVVVKYDEFNCTKSATSPRFNTDNITVGVETDCKKECQSTSTGEYYVGTGFDPQNGDCNPGGKIPNDVYHFFDDYQIIFEEDSYQFSQKTGNWDQKEGNKYWLGCNAEDFFGQKPDMDVKAGVVGMNNYMFAQGNIDANLFKLKFQVWDDKPNKGWEGVRGKTYQYKMRAYIQLDKDCSGEKEKLANAKFLARTSHGNETWDITEVSAYDNSTSRLLGTKTIYGPNDAVRLRDVIGQDYLDKMTGWDLVRFEVVFYGSFPMTPHKIDYFTFTPRFEEFGCAKVAFDYISAEVENVCLSPNVVCMGESTIANAAGFPKDSHYQWYREDEPGVWVLFEEGDDEKANIDVKVTKLGKQKHKLVVTGKVYGENGTPTDYYREMEFTVGGKNCSVPLEPMTIDCSKINNTEYVLGEKQKEMTIDLPLPNYTASCDPDPTMTIDIVVKDLDGKKLVGLNQSRSVTFPMSQLSTTNTKVESPAGTISLKYTIKDGCGREETCEAVITVSDKTAPNVNCDLIPNYTAHLKNQKECVAVPGYFPTELPNLTAPRLEDLNKVDGFITGEYIGRREQESRPSEIETSFSKKNGLNDPYNKGVTWILWKFSDKSGNAEYCLQKITVIDDKKPNVTCPTIDDLGVLDVDTLTCTLKPSSVIAKIKEVAKLPYGFDECSSTPEDSLVPTLYYRIPKEGDELHEIKSSQMNDPIFETGIKYELVWVFKKIGGAYVDESVSVVCPVSFMAEDQDAPEFDCSSLTDIFVYPNYSRSMVYDNFASGSGQVGDNSNMTYTLKNYFDNGSLSMHEDVQDVCGGKVTIEVKITDPDGKTSVMKTLDEFMKFQFKENPDLRQLNVYTITYTFTDARFNSKSCEQKVTVTRNLPPVPDCKTPTITMYKDENCDAIYNLKLADIPTASVKYYHEKRYGECSAGKPVTTKAAGPGGSIPIKFDEFIRSESASKLLDATVYPDSVRLYDANGNVVAVKNPLTITDKIVTKSVWFRYFDGDGVKYCAEDVEYGSAEANISNFKTLPSIVNNYNLPVGENRYVWYFSNAYDKSDPSAKKLTDSCVVTVIVKDTISPVLDCSIFDNPKKFYADESCELSQTDVEVENLTVTAFKAKDNCTTDPADFQLSVIRTFNSRKISSVVPPYDILKTPYKVGVTTLEWVVTDESGNSASCLQTIEVLDTIGPKVDCDVVTPPLTAYADANCMAEADIVKKVGLQIPEIDDDPCSPTGGKIKGVGERSDGKDVFKDAYPKGVTTITWKFYDASASHAFSVCEQTITVEDKMSPTFDCREIQDTTVALASDKCELSLEEVIKILGSHKAVDNCDGEITGKPMLDVDGVKEIELKAPFTALHKDTTYHFIWHFVDKSDNDKTCEQYLTVQDTTPPDASDACKDLTDKEVVAVDCELPFSKLDVNLNSSIIDKCDGEIKAKVQAFLKKYDGTEERYDDEEILNVTFPVGTHKFLYIYTDKAGLSDTCVMYRTIVDKEKPIILDCFGDTVMANVSSDVCGLTYDDLKDLIIIPKSYDNCDTKANDGAVSFIEPTVKRYFWDRDKNSNYELVVDGDNEEWKKDPFPVGLTKLVFTFTDKSGNFDTCTKYVNVEDVGGPNFDCSKIDPNPYYPIAEPGECEVKIGDIWSILDKEYIATRSCTDEEIRGVLTLYGSTNRVPADYVLEVGRDYHLTWVFRSERDGKVKTCDQIIRPNHQNPLDAHCENAADIDTIKATEGRCDVPGDSVITKFPFGIDFCTKDTIWGVPHRSDSLEISDPFPTGHTHITWTMVSPYNVEDTARCEQDINIKGNKHFDLNCDELTPAMHRVVDVCGPIVMSDTLNTPEIADPCANPDSSYYMRPGVGTRSDDKTKDPINDEYPLGQTWIQWVFTDFTGAVSDTCDQLVDVRTKLPLKVDCDSINKDTIVIAVAEGTCDVPAPQVMDSLINRGYPFAKHPCLTDTFVGVPTRPNGLTMDDPYHVGPNEIIWVFTDKKTHTLVDSVITCTQIVQVGDINVPPVDCSQMPDTSIILDPYDCDINFSEMNFNIKPVYDLCSGAHIDSVVTRASMPGQSSEFGDPILEVPFGVGVDTVYWKYDFGSYKFLCTQVITVKDSMEPVVDCDTILDEEIVLPEGICEIQKDMVLDSIKQPYAYEYCSNLEIKGVPQLMTISSTEDTTYSELPTKFNVGEPYKISWLFEFDSLTVLSKRCDIDLTIKSSTKPIFDCSVFKDTVKKYAEGECDVVLDDQILPIQEGKDACVKDYIVYGKAYKVDTVDSKPTYTLLAEMNEGTPSYKVEKLEVGVYTIAWVFESKYSVATDTCNEILDILTDKKMEIACVDLPTFAPTSDDSCSVSVDLVAPQAKNPCTNELILPDTVIRSDKIPFKGDDDTFFVGKTTVYWIYVDHSKTLMDSIDTCVQIVQVGDVKEEPIKCPKDTLVTLPIGVCQLHPDSIHLNATEPTFRDFCADTIVPLLKVWRASGKLITEPFDLGIDTIFREYFYHGVQYICEQQIRVRNAGIDSFNCDMLGKSKNDTVTVELKTAGNTVPYSEVERMGFTKPDLVKLNACGQLVDTFMRSDNLKLDDPYPLGETTITYVVKDTTHGSEQSKTCERIINVINTGAPVMKCPPLADQKYVCHKDIPDSYNSFAEFISAGGSFNTKDGTPALELVVPASFKVDSVILDVLNNKVNKVDLCEFTLIRTYSALDVRNQEVTPCSDTFRVKDSIPPVWGIGVKSTVETFVCTPTQPFDHSVIRAADECWGAVYSIPTEKTKTTDLKSGIFYTDSTNRSNDPNMCEYYNYDVIRRFVAYDACNNHSDTIKYLRRMRDTVPPTINVPLSFENAMIQADYTTPCIFIVPDVKGLLSPDIISENCPEYTMKPYKFTQVPPAGQILHTEDGYVDVSIIIEDNCGFKTSIQKRVIVPTRKSVVSLNMNDVTICADEDITLNSPLVSNYSGHIWEWDKYEGEYVYMQTGSVVFDYYRDTLKEENLIYSNDMSSNGWKFEQNRAKEYLALDSYYRSDRYYIVITDTIRLCRDTAFAQITIHDRPSVSLTPEVYRICEDDSLHLSSEFEGEDLYTKFNVNVFDMGDSVTKEGWLLGDVFYEAGTLVPYSDTLVSLKYYAVNGCGMSKSGQSIGVSTLEKMRPENLMLVTDPQDKPRVFRNEPADLKLITKYRPFEYHWYKVVGSFDGRYDETFDKEGVIKDKYKDLINEPDSLLGINYWEEPMPNKYQLLDLQDTASYYVLMIDSVCPAVPSNVVSINVVKDIPTAFTPHNSIGMNDVFMEGYPVIIFNRYGQKMVESNNGWDGTCRGELVDPGVYFYELVLRDKSKHKGTIEVVYFK